MAVKLGSFDWWPRANAFERQWARSPSSPEARAARNRVIRRAHVPHRCLTLPRYARHWAAEKARRFRLTSVNWDADDPSTQAGLRCLYRAVMGDE
jgi:hypothetical protein